jgi:hypothetical protein
MAEENYLENMINEGLDELEREIVPEEIFLNLTNAEADKIEAYFINHAKEFINKYEVSRENMKEESEVLDNKYKVIVSNKESMRNA